MTNRQAIKARHRDCTRFKCTGKKCPLHGHIKAREENRGAVWLPPYQPKGENIDFHFVELPRIGNRSDALELLEQLLTAKSVRGLALALTALKDAIKREII